MTIMLQLKYDVLRLIAKQCRDCGEDITLLHTKTRDRVQDLHGMWKGDAADKFFEEMELELLPPLNQTAKTLFAMQDVLLRVIKLVSEADQDTVNYFRKGFDFTTGSTVGGVAGTIGGSFTGAGFIPGLNLNSNQQGTGSVNDGAGVSGSGAGTDTGSGAGAGGAGGSQFDGQQEATSGQGTQAGSGAGGGGAGGVGQGWSGRTGSSTGVAGQGSQMGSAGAAGQTINPPLTPDHVYGGASAGGTSQAGGQQTESSSGGDPQKKEAGVAVGVTATTAAAGAGVASLGKAGRGVRKGRRFTGNNRINE